MTKTKFVAHAPLVPNGTASDHVLRDTARRYALANKSDPFAYARILKDMRHGYIMASEVAEDAERILNASGPIGRSDGTASRS